MPLTVIGLKGSEPCIELLCGKLVPEYFKTLMPHTVRHDSPLPITHKFLKPDKERPIPKDDPRF